MHQGRVQYDVRELDWETYASLLRGRRYPLYYDPSWLHTILSDDEILFGLYRHSICVAVFICQRKYGELINPPFCQYTGVFFLDEGLSQSDKQSICQQIHASLPKHTYFHLNFSPLFVDWLGFYWLGYKQTTRYNYVWDIVHLTTREQILRGMSSYLAKKVQQAERAGFYFDSNIQISDALALFERNGGRKGYQNDWNALKKLLETKNEQPKQIVGLRSKDGQLAIASLFVVHQSTAYFIAGGHDPSVSKRYFLNSLLLLSYILWQGGDITQIDFEGSMIEPIAKMYQALGAKPQPYMTLSRGRHRTLSFVLRRLLRI